MNQITKGIIIGTLITLIVVGLYLGFNYEKNKYLNQGYNSAVNNVAYSITTTGNIPLVQNISGNLTIKSYPISELCKNLGKTQ